MNDYELLSALLDYYLTKHSLIYSLVIPFKLIIHFTILIASENL